MINDDSSGFRAESHVAQQRRRDKLRNNSIPETTCLYPQNLLHSSSGQVAPADHGTADLSQVRTVRNCDAATMFSSEMLNFSANNQHVVLLSGKTESADQMSGHHQSSDWFANYAGVSGGGGDVFPGGMYSGCGSNVYNNNGHHDHGQKSYGEMNFSSSSPYFHSNAVHEAVAAVSSGMGSQGFENNNNIIGSLAQHNIRNIIPPTNHHHSSSSSSWMEGENKLIIDHQSVSMIHSKPTPTPTSHQWNGNELGFAAANRGGSGLETVAGELTARGLSLSLSSSSHQPASEMDHVMHFGQKIGQQSLHSEEMCNNSEDSKAGYIALQDVVGSSPYHRRGGVGPLGPFTGYATILKNSKYLRAAQQLLDEFCSMVGPRGGGGLQTCQASGRDDDSRELSISSDLMNGEGEIGGTSGVSSSSFNSSCEAAAAAAASGGGGEGQLGTRSCQSYHQPEFQQRQAKLLYMQEEVCRRYKQYHQQMHMVMSSFDSVAGLSSATPYTSLAVKTVSRHFRFLKGAISDQLRRISKLLGEDLLSHAGVAGLHGYEGDMAMPKFMDQGLRKQKSSGDRLGFLEPQHHIWRPQRGLPERAVAVLRAWLFDHFLHPYPTDTDKHMLANQTGLSRNQVSNWFINARVRVWKPMVEEMHMLETKNATDTDQDLNKGAHPKPNASSSVVHYSTQPKTSSECPTAEPIPNSEPGRGFEQWAALDKRSQMNCQVPNDGNLGLMSVVPYHQSGLGAVSLTLGLRHSTDGLEQRQVQQEHPLSRHYGNHMFQNFVG
ncbi:hypothetical protein Sjap_013824 [Stephania japonica]|uniref:Homeobox domain-containing protein n=1 Tax=Stephania japonica TaxID=461633 RepID=A0AAP0NY17_9MAGN